MNVKSQKRIAAKILGCGLEKVYVDPARLEEVSSALTTKDVRKLIRDGLIKRKPNKPKTVRKTKRKKSGSRKGAMSARFSRKKKWMTKIRALRRELKNLKDQGLMTSLVYRDLYAKAKGGFFRDKSHLKLYMEQHKLLRRKT